ncbi:MAG: bifunctional adenosylcobinamide kinase/adenosylcobinamide-phosphate guanylyltransferase [Candidatus Competibacterales bacterium]
MKELILGGARSGKSRLAEARATPFAEVVYIATAQALDGEMAARIARHKASRPPHWTTVEEPLTLAEALRGHAAPGRCIVVDCLTLWLSNWLFTDPEGLEAERGALVAGLADLPGEVVLVSNEVGQGIVPADPLTRQFRDLAGELHQALAEACDRVTLVVAGLPLTLKEPP